MKNVFLYLSPKSLKSYFGVLRSRFIFPSIIVIALTAVFLYRVNSETLSVETSRLIFSLVVTFFLSVGLAIFFETKGREKYKFLAVILPILYGILFYYTVTLTDGNGGNGIPYFILHLTGFVAFLFFAPYCKNLFYKEPQSKEYSNYFTRMAWTLLMSAIVGGSLLALGFIAIESVSALFDLRDFMSDNHVYENWAVLALSLIAPIYGLIHLPRVTTLEKAKYEINRFFSFLIKFIAVPFIILYFVILYAYSAKVLMNFQDWPKGMICWMVVGFSAFGYLTYIFSKSYEDESGLVRAFRKTFPYAVPAQIVMLGYAIYLRIDQYDLTMNRYFVVIFGFWLFVISAYYIFSQRKSLTLITASLAVLAILISFGPWSVYHLPLERQYDRLVNNLETAGILKNGTITPKTGKLDTALENSIYDGIGYVCGFEGCEKIKALFAKEIAAAEAERKIKWEKDTMNAGKPFPEPESWIISDEVRRAINVTFRYDDMTEDMYVRFMIGDSYKNFTPFPMSVVGYDTVMRIYGQEFTGNISEEVYLTVDPDVETLTLHRKNGSRTISLNSINDKLRAVYNNGGTTLNESDLTFMIQDGNTQIKLMFENYGFKKENVVTPPGDAKTNYLYISGYALIRN